MSLTNSLTATALLLCVTGCCCAAGFEYPPKGTGALVVYPKHADELEIQAADTMAYYLTKITGVAPKCVEETDNISAHGNIFVGRTRAGMQVIDDLGVLPEDGYRIRTRDGALYLRGSAPIGTLNAVTGFLQDNLDVVWGIPNPIWESVPRRERVVVEDLDVRSKPAYGYRLCSGILGIQQQAGSPISFTRAMRLSTSHFIFDHNMFRIISDAKYAKDHPEYFALIDGHRQTSLDSTHQGQPCFSNPDVFRLSVEAACKAFDDDPYRKTFSLCANDTELHCQCEKCAAMDASLPMWRGAPSYSNSYYDYLSRVAEEVHKTHPGRDLLAYAYWGTVCPPTNAEKLPNNVHISLTQDIPQHFDPVYRKQDMEALEQWRAKVSKLSVYVYMNLGWITPKYFPHITADYIKKAADMGVLGMYSDTNPNWLFQAPMVYVECRLLWDPSLDTDALLDHYMKSMFKDQSQTMAQFYGLMEGYWLQERNGEFFAGFGKWEPEAKLANAPLFNKAAALLADARNAATDREVIARLDWMLEYIKLPQLLIQNEYDFDKWADPIHPPLIFSDPNTVKAAEAMVDRDRKAIGEAVDVYMKDETYQQGYYRSDGFWAKLYTAFQNTQYTLAVGAVQGAVEEARRTGDVPDWEAARKWLGGYRLKTDISKYYKRAASEPIVDAADLLTAYNAPKKTVEVDGDLSDWEGLEFCELKHSPGPWAGEWPASCSAAVTWDDNNLYLAVKVPDAKHVQTHTDSAIWMEDSIQIGVDPLRDAIKQGGYGHYDPDDIELGFALCGESITGWCYTTPKPEPAVGYPAAVVHAGDQTCYEVALPWAKIMPDGKRPDSLISVNVAVNGSDGGARRMCSWTYGLLDLKDPRAFVNVWLKG